MSKTITVEFQDDLCADAFMQWLYLSNMSNFGFHDWLLAQREFYKINVTKSNFDFTEDTVTHRKIEGYPQQ